MTSSTERELRRLILSAAIGAVAAFIAFVGQASVVENTDFTQIWHAARGLLEGRNPYDVVGPMGTFKWPFPLLYPGTAVIAATPFALLSLRGASSAFVGIGAALMAWTFAADRSRYTGAWWVFGSATFLYVIRNAQWSPFLVASALTPSLGWLLACKPSVGLALFVAFPRRRTVVLSAAFVAGSLAVLPTWPRDWLGALPSAYHMTAPVTYVTAGGPLILLALLRWRRPEARLLVALGCIPHTTMPYEAVPLFLVARRWQEGLLLAAASWGCMYRHSPPGYLDMMHGMAWRMTLFLYLPCLVMVMLRPNRWTEFDADSLTSALADSYRPQPNGAASGLVRPASSNVPMSSVAEFAHDPK